MKLSDAVRIGVDAAWQIARGQDYAQELAERVDQAFCSDAGTGVCRWTLSTSGISASMMLGLSRVSAITPAQIAVAESVAGRHPSYRAMLAGPAVQRVSDVVEMPRFWDSDVYAAMHAHTEGRYPAALTLHRAPTTLLFLGVHRQGGDLDDDELACLAALGEPVRAALAFRATLDDAIAHLGDSPGGSDGPFTRREAEAILLASRGWTTRRIARQLGISDSAVKLRLSSARDRVGAASRTELVARWARIGALDQLSSAQTSREGPAEDLSVQTRSGAGPIVYVTRPR